MYTQNLSGMLYQLIRPILFRLDPERAHELALSVASFVARRPRLAKAVRAVLADPSPRPVRIGGLEFPNAIGLAAGLDKNAEAPLTWWALGFGFAEIGTVTPKPQAGQPRPRLFRLPRLRALVNRMGFNNDGAEVIAQRLEQQTKAGLRPPIPLGMSIGKNSTPPFEEAASDYAQAARHLAPHADFLTVNVSSPNSPGLRALQSPANLAAILAAVREAAGAKPVYVKLSPELEADALCRVVDTCLALNVAGFIATNTLATDGQPNLPTGGLSGRPLHAVAVNQVQALRRQLGDGIAVVGCGGIDDVASAREMFQAGANLIQLYTGLVFRGPGLPGLLSRKAGPQARNSGEP